ncbi:MAG TPA: GNAT family N-acetyltransferase [Tepidisphaeraceae bacterium]|nr:GNAT family N-acetyltransferase [Tepidisphaeraceae bacterium]
MTLAPFQFFDAGPLVDGDLELVAPHASLVDDFLAAAHHPQTLADDPAHAAYTRERVVDFLAAGPGGRYAPDDAGRVPAYAFWMRLRGRAAPLRVAGGISLRVSNSPQTVLYFGHVGYNVFPAARGHRYAARAVKLLLPLAKAHGLDPLWITCNPDNLASRRTIERVGGRLVNVVPLPPDHPLRERGDVEKCRYLIKV